MSRIAESVFGPGGFVLTDPLWLVVLVPISVGALVWAARRRPAAIAWPALAEARSAGGHRIDPQRGLTLALRAGALLGLAAVVAGPTWIGPADPESLRGLDLVLVVDASGSMRALDAEIEDEWRTRLDLARSVVRRFARHRVADGDRVGLVVFGETAFTLCPLTSDGALLGASLDRLEAGMAGEATALGDALALAVKRVSRGVALAHEALDATPGEPSPGPHAGRLVVLLTDGRTNAGSVPPDLAAALAASAGVRVHTVGIGSGGDVAVAQETGRALRLERHDLDRATLRTLAAATGGRSFESRSATDLQDVYDEIDALERVPRPAPPRSGGVERPEPLLAMAGLFLLGEIGVARVFARRLP